MTPALEDSKPHSLTSRFEAASTISASAVPCSGGLKICVEGIAALGHAHRSPIRASVNLGWLPAKEKRAWSHAAGRIAYAGRKIVLFLCRR